MKRVCCAWGFCFGLRFNYNKIRFRVGWEEAEECGRAPKGNIRRLNFYSLAKRLELSQSQRRWTLSRHSNPRHLYERCGPRGFLPTKREIDRRSFPETLALENPLSSRTQMVEGFQTRRTQTSPRHWFPSQHLAASSETLAVLHEIDGS